MCWPWWSWPWCRTGILHPSCILCADKCKAASPSETARGLSTAFATSADPKASMKLKQLSRTATFAWGGPAGSAPLIATGAIAGALDENFSNESQLEIWAPSFYGDDASSVVEMGGAGMPGPAGSVKTNARFNRIVWSSADISKPQGIIAAGMETGEVSVYDADAILTPREGVDPRIFKTDKHTGPVKGLDFNSLQKNLLLTGATGAEIFLYDLNKASPAPFPPGPASTKLDEITAIQWNPTVARVFAASSSSGFTSVWDLKAGKEVISLAYGGGAGRGMDALGGQAGLQMGKRRGMSDVCWHPEIATKVVTCSEDDESPVIMVWDLRNSRAPEKIMSGHQKGVLSISWCKQDSDLLLSCGKDNRTLCWNPQTCEIVGEVPPSNDWSFQTSWCPRNPDLLATASFDGTIGIHSLQATHHPETSTANTDSGRALQNSFGSATDDPFSQLAESAGAQEGATPLSLKQPPKWLRRPVSAVFGFGGQLASTSNLTSASGKNQSAVVHLQAVVSETDIVSRAQKLDGMLGKRDSLADYCSDRLADDGGNSDASWKALHSLFSSDSREQLIQMLGFSKEDVTAQVKEAVKRTAPEAESEPGTTSVAAALKDAGPPSTDGEAVAGSPSGNEAPDSQPTGKASPVPVEVDAPDAPSSAFFGDDQPPSTPAADFFSSMATASTKGTLPSHVVPHVNYAADSSVAATVGSQASSVRSEIVQDTNTFKIYPSDESPTDKLITKALVFGDYDSAVSLCLASDRFADALLLAVQGGPDLLQRTQKAYFESRTTAFPFLRLFQSIVANDLLDIVQNADLAEWQVVFVVVCTFANDSDFASLTEQLGERLNFKGRMLENSENPEAKTAAIQLKKDATLCFLAARKLEKVVNIWVDELKSEEAATLESPQGSKSLYTAHAQALQTFIEKVAIFESATGYVDSDLLTPTQSTDAALAGARTYRLAGLYDRYYEYADLLAAQGLIDLAVKYASKTPADYKGTGGAGSQLDKARERLLQAAGDSKGLASRSHAAAPATILPNNAPVPSAAPPFPEAMAQAGHVAYGPASAFVAGAYAPSTSPYAPTSASVQYSVPSAYSAPGSSPYAPSQSFSYGQAYGTPSAYQVAPPPPPASLLPDSQGPPLMSSVQRRDIPGWNDAPSLAPPKRPASVSRESPKPQPIMSPFPVDPNAHNVASQSQPQMGAAPPQRQGPPPNVIPPPPRGPPMPRQAPPLAPPAPSASGLAQQQPRGPPLRSGGPPPGTLAGPPPRGLSPLGPAGRVTSPSSMVAQRGVPGPSPGGLLPSGAGNRPISPQAQIPPPPGSRLAGPPPPGRGLSNAPRTVAPPVSQPPPSRPSPDGSAPPSRATQQVPVNKHPSGDRSHIPAQSRPVYEVLSAELTRVQQSSPPPHLKRIIDDTARRLSILFDGLNSETVPATVISDLLSISQAIARRDANAALSMHVNMLTNAEGDMTSWAPGVKQLIRLSIG